MTCKNHIYCVEVYVQHLEQLKIHLTKPSIIFRFAEYPIVLIVPDSSKVVNDVDDDDVEYYPFFSGKSCLIRVNEEQMITYMNDKPLQLYLAEIVNHDEPRLIGHSHVSLSASISTLKLSTGDRNEFQHHTLSLYNFGGVAIGQLRVYIRVAELGTQLETHFDSVSVQSHTAVPIASHSGVGINWSEDRARQPPPLPRGMPLGGLKDLYTDNTAPVSQLYYQKTTSNEREVPTATNLFMAARAFVSEQDRGSMVQEDNENKPTQSQTVKKVRPHRRRVSTMSKRTFNSYLKRQRKNLRSTA